MKNIDVMLHKIRQKLPGHVRIRTLFGGGWLAYEVNDGNGFHVKQGE